MFNNIKFVHKVTLVSATLLILSLTVTTANNYRLSQQKTNADLNNAMHGIAKAVSDNIANWLNGKLAIISAVGHAAAEDPQRESIIKVIQQADRAGNFKNAYVALEDKTFLLDDLSIQLPADFDATGRPWYTQVKQEPTPSFTEPYVDVTINKLLISAVAPVLQQGQFAGTAGGDILLNDITEVVNSIDFLGLGYAYLVTADGKILSHPDSQWADKHLDDFLGQSITISDTLREYELDGKTSLVSFIPIEGIQSVNWYLGVVLDKDKANAPLNASRNQSMLYGFIGLVVTIGVMQLLLNYLMRPIGHLNSAIKDIAQGEGDLTQRLQINSDDEFGRLSSYFNHFIETIHHSISEVHTAANALNQSMRQLRSTTQASLHMSNEQVSRADNVATAINELGASASEISANAARAAQLTDTIHTTSDNNRVALSDNSQAISQLSVNMQESSKEIIKLNDHTDNIGQILEVIKGVSAQTNLLALNAAIEAARAGEAGRGFAVVADEVRQLAQRTQDSTQEIEAMILNLQTGAQSVVTTMEHNKSSCGTCVDSASHAGDQMSEIIVAIDEVVTENQSVATATEQQSKVIQTLDEDILQLTQLNQQETDNLEQTMAACDQLQQQFESLNTLVSRFRL